jgi:hypothetical protein
LAHIIILVLDEQQGSELNNWTSVYSDKLNH